MFDFIKNSIPGKVVAWIGAHPAETFIYAAAAVAFFLVF